jgi:hypothetical protein
MNIYYIYQHRRKDTGQIFYVGKGKNKRCSQRSNRSKEWKNITNQTEYTIEILFENLPQNIALLVEIGLITKYKIEGIQLCNSSIGGQGPLGYKHPQISRELISRKRKGYKLSEEHKRKISSKRKGQLMSDEQKLQISNTLKGRKLSEEHKQKIRESLTKKIKFLE